MGRKKRKNGNRKRPPIEQHQAVIRGLTANAIPATLEYPGCVVIELDPETTVWTGLESWDYGTIYRLHSDTMTATDEPAQPDGLSNTTQDVETIVAAWTDWARQQQPTPQAA